jgi:DNA modification methylase/transcriptional regulator with XRE-family HTH domain
MSVRILVGDARTVLATLPAESVHCVVSSPPYWGLRDYQLPPTVWGGDNGCAHTWDVAVRPGMSGGLESPKVQIKGAENFQAFGATEHATCARCDAWRGTLGLEPDPGMYVAHLVDVFRAVRRVLRADGTCWVNLGDSYAANGAKVHGGWNGEHDSAYGTRPGGRSAQRLDGAVLGPAVDLARCGLKPKDLIGIPWRVAFALQADGWYLRSEIIWHKPNPMPESVTDRPTKAHEQLFLLAKRERYFYDGEAIKEHFVDERNGNPGAYDSSASVALGSQTGRGRRYLNIGKPWNEDGTASGRNKRSVWTIPSAPFPLAHFATFPPALVEPCVQAGTSARGACPACGAPWARVGKIPQSVIGDAVRHAREQAGLSQEALAARLGIYVGNIWNWEVGGCLPRAAKWDDLMAALGLTFSREAFIEQAEYLVTGRQAGPKQQAAADDPFVNRPYAERKRRLHRDREWVPTCACAPQPVPCVVLDPFAGAGTVGLVADRLGRDAILIELKPAYAAMAERRIREEAPLLTAVEVEAAAPPPNGNGSSPPAPEQLALDWSEIARVDV